MLRYTVCQEQGWAYRDKQNPDPALKKPKLSEPKQPLFLGYKFSSGLNFYDILGPSNSVNSYFKVQF